MSKTATTYTVRANGQDVGTKSKKATACALAEQVRAELKVEVQVVTNTGTVVYTLAAPTGKRVIKNRTAPYKRVDKREPVLAEGVQLPEGYEVTYLLPRNKISVLRDPETLEYLVFDHLTGESEVAETCRQCSAIVKDIKAARKNAVAPVTVDA